MKQKLYFLLRSYLYWMILSMIAKIIFIIYQGMGANPLSVYDYGRIFYHGLRIDLSLGGYITMLYSIILAATPWLEKNIARRILTILTSLLAFTFWTVVVVDLELFKSWGYHIDATPLLYLKTPKEAMASTSNSQIAILTIGMLILTALSVYTFMRYIARPFNYKKGQYWQPLVFLLIGGAMIIPIRGGFNVAPMNSSFVFFHKTSMFANQAAINPVWNFMYEVMHIKKIKNTYNFMPQNEAQQIVDTLNHTNGNYPRLLKNSRPNIVVLLLESFTVNAIEVLGGKPGVTPELNKLAKEGILFTNIYATGNRSDRGLVGVISAYPSHPNLAMIKYPNKTSARPRFPKDLEENGYNTRFYYAGDINFGSFRSYITMSFQDMVTEQDFSGKAKENSFKWGVHDEYMFERLYDDLSKAQQPFMYMAFNMSSHEPFDVPMQTKIQGESSEAKFMNAIYYTDSCIGNLIRKYKQSGMWENTLFVLIADHGTRHIGNLDSQTPRAYQIPMIFTGGALNVRDTVVETIGSQTDMVATLFDQLGIDHSGYKYSRNLLADDVIPFAFYSYSGMAGVISQDGRSLFDMNGRHFIQGDSLYNNTQRFKAYLQVLDNDINGSQK